MKNRSIIERLVLFALLIICILLIVFKRDSPQIYTVAPQKTIVTRIENKEKDIIGLMNQIAIDRQVIQHIGKQLKDIKNQLADAKVKKDTASIVKLQDVVIAKQDTTIYQFIKMDRKKDSVIVDQRYIINSKDTIIAIQQHDIKKVKKQRNISVMINVVLAALLIIK